MDIDQMQAGPELDETIAIRVMKWPRRANVGFVSPDGLRVAHPGAVEPHRFSPSTDIGDAWEVVEQLRDLRLFVNVNVRQKVAWCRIEDYDGEEMVAVKADTAPLAICLAALKSVAA